MTLPAGLSAELPVLIAGATASGKSALALDIAAAQGGIIINADAIQVYDNWRILTARPSEMDEQTAPHALYGHLPYDATYSVGHWLREVAPLLLEQRPIIVGGTGLYFTALTEGLADIPATPAPIRALANERISTEGFKSLLAELDPASAVRIDQNNPMRVQRAWEVLQSTGRGIANWQDNTPPPLLPLDQAQSFLFDLPKDTLTQRINKRFGQMIQMGALDEARANLNIWDPQLLSSKAIGARELIAHLNGETDLKTACDRATIATRQFAKRQRTWFKSRMKRWTQYHP